MLQMGTNIIANQVKTPIQNYFEKSVACKFDMADRFLPCGIVELSVEE